MPDIKGMPTCLAYAFWADKHGYKRHQRFIVQFIHHEQARNADAGFPQIADYVRRAPFHKPSSRIFGLATITYRDFSNSAVRRISRHRPIPRKCFRAEIKKRFPRLMEMAPLALDIIDDTDLLTWSSAPTLASHTGSYGWD